jgi:molybdopterin converting factor small subunit
MIMDEDLTTLAVNEEYVDSNGVTLKNGDTVAVIPPISGG